MPVEDSQFIFREAEFENEGFHAATFVSKYRTVCPLEDLKEQLLVYSNGLKHHLYDIINRDYKDFITISTKVGSVKYFALLEYFLICCLGTVGWC